MDQRVLHGLLEKLEENPATSEQNSKPAFSFPSPGLDYLFTHISKCREKS